MSLVAVAGVLKAMHMELGDRKGLREGEAAPLGKRTLHSITGTSITLHCLSHPPLRSRHRRLSARYVQFLYVCCPAHPILCVYLCEMQRIRWGAASMPLVEGQELQLPQWNLEGRREDVGLRAISA